MEQPIKEFIPHDMRELLFLLNATHIWHMSVYVYEQRIEIFDGDQPFYYAQTMAEAEAFLIGCFSGTFPGKDLKCIRTEIATGMYDGLFSTEALTFAEQQRMDYARERLQERQTASIDPISDKKDAVPEEKTAVRADLNEPTNS